jgi:hypothetical protein
LLLGLLALLTLLRSDNALHHLLAATVLTTATPPAFAAAMPAGR